MSDPITPNPAAPLFQAVNLSKEYDGGKVQALRGVDFEIREGEFASIIGRSGSGKSTLLQLLGGLDRPSGGTLNFRGQSMVAMGDLSEYRAKRIGFVFQAFHLLPTFTAMENVQIPMFEMGWPAARRKEVASELLNSVGLGHRLDHLPTKLSGGERQRVAIARSLANSPSVLLADEPTGNLDTDNAKLILDLLVKVRTDRKMSMILVTHDPVIARMADRVIHVKDGRVVPEEEDHL
jgi:ABC-type lipoprotein export system ATPase subunit